MRALVLVCVLVLATGMAAGCGADDNGEETSAAEQAQDVAGQAARCSQRSFRVAFDPDGTIVVASSDDTLASLSDTEQTLSGRCTLVSETVNPNESQLTESSAENVTLVCNVREPADFVIGEKELLILVRPEAIVAATVGEEIRWVERLPAGRRPLVPFPV